MWGCAGNHSVVYLCAGVDVWGCAGNHSVVYPCAGVDVWGRAGNHSVLTRRPHIPQSQSVLVGERQRRAQELGPRGSRLDGRLQQVLLREDWTQLGKLVVWLSGRTSVLGQRAFAVLRSACS